MKGIVIFVNIVTINIADESVKLNTILVKYIKDCLLIYLNSLNVAIQYSEQKNEVLSSFYKLITKPNTDNIFKEVIDEVTILNLIGK